MIEFSSVSMPITAPGADQVLKLLEALDKRGQAVVEKLGAMQKVGTLYIPDRLAKPIEDAGHKAAESATHFEHLGVKAAFAGAQLAQGAEGGLKPFAHQLAFVGAELGAVGLASTTFIAVAGEALVSWFMHSREEAEKLEKQLDDLERQIGRADLMAAAKELQGIFSGDKYHDGDDAISKLIRSGGILKLRKEISELDVQSKKGLESAQAAASASMGQAIVGEVQGGATGRLMQARKDLDELTKAYDRIKAVFDEKVKQFGSQTAANAKIEQDKKDEDRRKDFHEEVVNSELEEQNERNRLMREAYERETAETLRVLEEGWKREKEAREAHDKAVIAQARQLASDISRTVSDAISGFAQGGGLESLKESVLAGLGEILIGIGTTMIAASPWLKAASSALLTLSGGGSLAAGLGLVALGASLTAIGSSHGGSGGGASYGAPSIGASIGPQIVSAGPSSAPNMSGVKAATPVIIQATFFGKHDARAGRELLEMIEYHQRRRS